MDKKRILTIGDLHCGHRAGLTPNGYESQLAGHKYKAVQMDFWREYEDVVDSLRPVDVLVVNGDCVDGHGHKSGATELIVTDVNRQIEMAWACIEYVGAEMVFITYGTPYHVGASVEYEKALAKQLGCQIDSQLDIDVNGLLFNFRHFLSASSVPYGQGTPLAKARFWNLLWSEFDEYPKADIVVRSHTHWFTEMREDNWRAVALPSLQGHGSKFGARIVERRVNWGLVWFDVVNENEYTMTEHIVRPQSQRSKPVVI